ncbi:WhiB family transcriptional regulator [Streptacidiphilus monticola]|uniref:Transcriptional regulator WhiB n=1 Tax=Streptacidiphilus monticola TaxID=2161674 RepID=A0ABW1G4Z9_9ACTN
MARHRTLTAIRALALTSGQPDGAGHALNLIVGGDDLAGAVCRAVDPDVFFPDPDDTEAIDLAKAICAACPVKLACLERALTRFEQIGVFGGTTGAERAALTGRSNQCGSHAGYSRHRRYGEPPCTACREAYNARQRVNLTALRDRRKETAA